MAYQAAPIIDWSGGTPPQAQGQQVSAATIAAIVGPRVFVIPAPIYTKIISDPGVGYAS